MLCPASARQRNGGSRRTFGRPLVAGAAIRELGRLPALFRAIRFTGSRRLATVAFASLLGWMLILVPLFLHLR